MKCHKRHVIFVTIRISHTHHTNGHHANGDALQGAAPVAVHVPAWHTHSRISLMDFSFHMILFSHTDFKDLKDCYAIRYAMIQHKKRNNTVLCHSGRRRPQGPHPAKHPRWFKVQGRALCPSATNVDETRYA